MAPAPSLLGPGASSCKPPPALLRAHEVAPPPPTRASLRTETEPLDADLRRLHVTVSRRLLEKVEQARRGLSHRLPCATMEQVLEAALDALLETSTSTSTGRRPHVPAVIERAVRLRDDNRCQFPLDTGGICGSTHQIELDHLRPVALGGETTVANLRCVCAFHDRLAARRELGDAVMAQARSRRRRPPGQRDLPWRVPPAPPIR